jgi:2-dehydro-3-deoxy-D-arabinonate dehydratase
MHIFRFSGVQGSRVGLDVDGKRYDLSAAAKEFTDISTWLSLADPVAAVRNVMSTARSFPIFGEIAYLPPVDEQEVWASGVTYLRSKSARMEESKHGADFYDKVYEAERPEIFFKATPVRVSGPGKPIRIRRDSTWNVPEPELALVLASSGTLAGFTIGNDMSSRSIEGENPLYLPQAKTYDGCCALGPGIALNDGSHQPRTIQMTIRRNNETVYSGETSTGMMRRSLDELARYLFRELTFPKGVFLLTGTGIVPPDDFTLLRNDIVRIQIEGIGTLENPVEGG